MLGNESSKQIFFVKSKEDSGDRKQYTVLIFVFTVSFRNGNFLPYTFTGMELDAEF